MKDNKLLKFLICAGIPLLILVGMTVTPLMTLMYGQEILIKTRPVDPRDVFRGDYVVLSYDINELPIGRVPAVFKTEDQWEKLRQVPLYVLLKKEGAFYVADSAAFERPAEGIYLRAFFQYPVWSQNPTGMGSTDMSGIQVTYNLDQYFVPENTGTTLEELARKGELTATVKVWNGYGSLISIRPQTETQ